MKTTLVFVMSVLLLAATATGVSWYFDIGGFSAQQTENETIDADIPNFLKENKKKYSKSEFHARRNQGLLQKRGIVEGQKIDPEYRQNAIVKLEDQLEKVKDLPASSFKDSLLLGWTPIGPTPIPNGQTNPSAPVSGRTISIAVHPTNPNIVYVGTAMGGLYRSTDGGTNWTPLMDGAQSLAIGAIAIAPSSPETVYVGTGEATSGGFFGVGVYRIDNASTTATLTGPFGGTSFAGNSISRIIVHPTVPGTIFVSSHNGRGGIRSATTAAPTRGVYRSTNATSATPTFAGIALGATVRDMAIDPTDPNILVINFVAGGGGLFRIPDALAATPSAPVQVQAFPCTTFSNCNVELASQRSAGAGAATFYGAAGDGNGQVWRSTDGGVTWTMQVDNNFCGGQCFYDIAIAVDPTDPAKVYLGGDPTLIVGASTDSGLSFTDVRAGLHVDTHALAVAPSSPATVYLGTDGGIYKSTDSGASFTPLNNSQFSATQFMSIAVHPSNPNFTIGGTQDNGTNFYRPDATWTRADFGDGGYAQIDQNAADTTNVRMYHTYFSDPTLQGYGTVTNTGSASDGNWSFRGCSGGNAGNGITCNPSVNFYAPLERGPGSPINTIYYGTDRLYRSADGGFNHTVVSQGPITGSPLSSIGISPQNDNVRIVGLNDGAVFGTSTGSATLTDLDAGGTIPNVAIARTVIDPNSQTTAYVTLSAFGENSIWKTTNLNAGTPTWTSASGAGGTAIPQIPVNSFVIDPADSNMLYAGTDIGVYASNDAGATWAPFGTGLPRVAVFGMAITPAPRKLRIATHGKGMFEIPLNASSADFDYDGDGKTDVSIFRPGPGQWWIQRSQSLTTFVTTFGVSTDKLVPADFTGDGKDDVAFFRPATGEWFILRSEDNSFFAFPFGTNGDIPAPGDYDGDGKADPAVFRPATATWFINNSGGGVTTQAFGLNGDQPIPRDYDGDGKDDLAIYRPSVGEWYYQRSSDLGVIGFSFGSPGDRALPSDFTGDGKADIAFFRPASGEWFILRSEDNSFFAFPFGTGTDIPSPGDYDGDGKTDPAVFRPATATWFINGSTAGSIIQGFGATGDTPTPSVYVR